MKLILYPKLFNFYIAYFSVKNIAFSLYFSLFFLYSFAISISNGSSGFGSVNNEQIDNNNFDIVNAGLKILLIYLNKYHHFY